MDSSLIAEILNKYWDPLGVAKATHLKDEYDWVVVRILERFERGEFSLEALCEVLVEADQDMGAVAPNRALASVAAAEIIKAKARGSSHDRL